MKIAVIGGNGFIGSRIVEQLHLANEHAVVPVVRGASSLARPARFKLEWRLADALDATALRTALEGCDAVVHAAAGRGRELERMPAILCAAAAAAGIKRVVYLSSMSVHGVTPEPGTNEHSPLVTTHASEEINHRVIGEQVFFQRCERLHLEGIALRPGLVYGPRSAWFADLVRDLREGRAWWFGDGRGIFNGIYVDNLVSAVFSALAAPAAATGKPYLVGDEDTVTWREFYLATTALVGAHPRRIANVTQIPAEKTNARSRLRRLADSRGVQAVVPVMPSGVKRFAKYMLSTPAGPVDSWAPQPTRAPAVTAELALQQQCRWRFPHKRAARALGFHAPVTFALGLKRTAAWLAFAEGESPRVALPAGADNSSEARASATARAE
ncbi:MAG TPA: NAD(P)-dependent oxidoreductase [Opitutaceae bacterium]|nr:NAD(P)-dependent oxidoreductase [Opitutaceae bacterium]